MKKRITAFLLAAIMTLAFAGCSGNNSNTDSATSPSPSALVSESPTPTVVPTETPQTTQITTDRQGNPITLPEKIEKIMVAGPSNGEVLAALGFADKIVAADKYSTNIEGVKSDVPLFDMAAPDVEQIVNLKPDVIFVTGMVKAGGDDPYKPFKDAGICVIYIPSSKSIDEIKDDIRYIAVVMGVPEKSESLINDMENEIAAIKAIGDTITEKKNVYFEISAAPYMYSFGNGVFLNEMLEIIGANNVFADQTEWISVADEAVIAANPDVILTSVNYIDNPTDEIKARAGWNALTAVKDNAVYYIDTDASNRPSQNIVKALKEMAIAVYPDKYK